MGFVATNLAKVPSEGFDWYLFLLTDGWDDSVQKNIINNFDKLSSSVGENCLVIRGADPESFYSELMVTQLGNLSGINDGQIVFPSLVLSSHSLQDLEGIDPARDSHLIMLIPLRLKSDLIEFLRELSETIQSGTPKTLFEENSKVKWNWLNKYLELKPNICGVGVDFNQILEDIFES